MLGLFLIMVSVLFTVHVSGEHVIVVGGGISGQIAARELVERGIDVTILEGSDRLGGRAYSRTTSGGNKVDLGCQWVMGTISNPVWAYAVTRPFQWNLVMDDNSWAMLDQNGVRIPQSTIDALDSDVAKIEEKLYSFSMSYDMPLQFMILQAYYIVRNTLTSVMATDESYVLWYFDMLYSMNYAAGLDQMGTISFGDDDYMDFSRRMRFVEQGYGNLIRDYLEFSGSYQVIFDALVTGVEHSSSSVVVTFKKGRSIITLQADAVIVTVSLGVLKSGTITFNPPPSTAFQTSLSHRHAGAVDKFVFVFDEKFWGNFNYWSKRNSFLEFAAPDIYENEAMLFVFIGYHNSVSRQNLTDAELTEVIYEELKNNIFPNVRPFPPYKEVIAGRWSKNPLFMGGWSYSGLGTIPSQDFTNIHQVSNRVQIAGEHTSREYFGSVNAAIISGNRAAKKLGTLYDWKPCRDFMFPGPCTANGRCRWQMLQCKPRNTFAS